jgi:hypothetical protein
MGAPDAVIRYVGELNRGDGVTAVAKPMKPVFLLLALAWFPACHSANKTDGAHFSNRTDYIIGETYIINTPVFLFRYDKNDTKETAYLEPLGFSGTPSNLADFIKQARDNPQVAGLLLPGDMLRVVNITEIRSVTIGNFLEIVAEVVTGEKSGTMVKLSMISKERSPSYDVFIDREYLTRADNSLVRPNGR